MNPERECPQEKRMAQARKGLCRRARRSRDQTPDMWSSADLRSRGPIVAPTEQEKPPRRQLHRKVRGTLQGAPRRRPPLLQRPGTSLNSTLRAHPQTEPLWPPGSHLNPAARSLPPPPRGKWSRASLTITRARPGRPWRGKKPAGAPHRRTPALRALPGGRGCRWPKPAGESTSRRQEIG